MTVELPPPEVVRDDVARALAEDVGTGDVSAALIPEQDQAAATLITRDAGVWCGRAWVTETAAQVATAIKIRWAVDDGAAVAPDQLIATFEGPARALLTAERTMLNFAGVDGELMWFVADRNPAKNGKFLPGSHIPIVGEDELREARPDYVLILPWNLEAEITEQLAYVRSWGGKFVTAVPSLRVDREPVATLS